MANPKHPNESKLAASPWRAVGLTIAGTVVIVAAGIAHGALTHRWGPGDELARAADVVESFPESFGPWRLQDASELPDVVAETLQCAGYVNRRYLNVDTSEVVSIAVIVGPPGPTSVHTPEICYSSRDYSIDQGPNQRVLETDGEDHAFWELAFRSNLPGGPPLQVAYAWATDGVWVAAQAPRFRFGGSPFLYKIQVAGVPQSDPEQQAEGLCTEFLTDLLQTTWRPMHPGS